jgi:hypothetical protein
VTRSAQLYVAETSRDRSDTADSETEEMYKRLVRVNNIKNKHELFCGNKNMETLRILRNQKTVPDNEKGINNIENGGKIEEGAELWCQQTMGIEVQTQKEQAESVEKREKDSRADMQVVFISVSGQYDEKYSGFDGRSQA